MIYLDNSASTYYKPWCVKWSAIKSLFLLNANPGRAGHLASVRSSEAIFRTREILADTFGVMADRVVFTSGCTEAINLAIIGSVKKGGHIITTCFEHNAVLRTLEYLKDKGEITYSVIYPKSDDYVFSISEFEKARKENSYMIIVNHISNVVGVEQNISQIGEWAHKNKLLFVVDGAQSAGHRNINMYDGNIDMLALAGHKGLLGLQGAGALLVSDGVQLKPIKYGGTGTYSESVKQPNGIPEGLESGTLPTIPIVTLGEGCKYAYKQLAKYETKIRLLTDYLLEGLANIDNVLLYTPFNALNGVVAFNVKGYTSSEVADYLNESYNIAVRSGLQCAPYVHKFLGTLGQNGVVRVSISSNTTKKQIKKFMSAIKKLNN